MIARMSKYDLVLYAGQSSDFIEKLRGLGLVDITTTGWEPSDEDRQLLLTIDNHHKAVETLKRFLEDERFVKDEQPIADGGEAFDRYMAATQQAAALRSEIARLQKTADELRPWGDFSVDTLRKLADKGVVLRYFFTSRAAYEKDIEAWSERYTIALVHEGETFDYFVVVTRPGEEVVLDAQEVKGADDGLSSGRSPDRRGLAGSSRSWIGNFPVRLFRWRRSAGMGSSSSGSWKRFA